MGFIYVIIGLVAFVTLYDYVTSKSWQQITSSNRNELVFGHRNRGYGAYVLRTYYEKRMLLITFILLIVLTAVFGVYFYIRSLPVEKEDTNKMMGEMVSMDMMKPKKEATPPPPPPPPPPPKETPPPVKTVAFPPPIVSDRDDEEPIEIPDENTNVGKETKDGVDDPFAFNPDDEEGTPEFKENKVVEQKIEPYTFVDEEAEYPGGFAGVMQFINDNYKYPDIAREMQIQGKLYVRFVVNTDGTVSDVSIEQKMVPSCPECDSEALRVIRKLNGWKPGKIAGRSVPQWYVLPISLSLGN
jgi:protein TonB